MPPYPPCFHTYTSTYPSCAPLAPPALLPPYPCHPPALLPRPQVLLEGGDLMVLCGEARFTWTHGIRAVTQVRQGPPCLSQNPMPLRCLHAC